MKKTPFLIVVLAASLVSTAMADEKRPVDEQPLDASFLRLYAQTRGFMLGRPSKPKPTPDGKAVLFLRSEAMTPKMSLFEFNVASRETKELLTPAALLKGAEEHLSAEEKARRERMRVSVRGFTDFLLSEDGKRILLSLSGKLYLFERATAKVTELATSKGILLDPRFSRDGLKVAYVIDHDVYVYDIEPNKEHRLTTGGTSIKTHGLAEFVAQEEMGRFQGYWWSPDGKYIAYEEADHDGVEKWYVADPTKPEQTPLPQYYPRPGKKNVAVRLGIIPVTGGVTVWVDWDAKKFEYLAAVRWDKYGPLTIQVQDRKQQELLLLLVDPQTGKTKKLLEEKDKAFVNIQPGVPRWLGSMGFVWIGELDGAPALEFHDADGRLQERLVAGNEGFKSLLSVSLQHREIIYTASKDPTQAAVFRKPIFPIHHTHASIGDACPPWQWTGHALGRGFRRTRPDGHHLDVS